MTLSDCPPKNLHKTTILKLKACVEEKKKEIKVISTGKRGPTKKDYITALKLLKVSSKPKGKKVHPPYEVMIKTAILADVTNKRKGTSRQAIKSYIAANYPSIKDETLKTYLAKTLKKLVSEEKLMMSGVRFKLGKKTDKKGKKKK